MAETETILNPDAQDNSDLTIDNKAEGLKAPTDTQEVAKEEPSSWVSGLDPELKEHPSLKNFKNPNDLAKSWVNAQKLIGKDKIAMINEKSTPEEVNAFYNKLGRPEKPEGYKFEPLPEHIQNESRQKSFAELAHRIGLPQKQAAEILKWYGEEANAEISQKGEVAEATVKETETQLRREWGMAYQQKLNTANKVLSMADPETQKELIEAGVGRSPRMIKFLASLGAKFSESGIVGRSPDGMMSPEEAKAEIQKIKANPAYLNGEHPEHRLMVERMSQLFKMLHPE